MDKYPALKQYFGHTQFRPGQERLIDAILAGRLERPAAEDGLLSALKALRSVLARAENVPAYIVFSNAALTDMAVKKTQTMEEFLEVAGVGQVKAARYGENFLREIAAYQDEI